MLYDPKWEKTTTANPFTLEGLTAWLEQKCAIERYDYTNPRNCALCQYFKEKGFADVIVAGNSLFHSGGRIDFPTILQTVVHPTDRNLWTFGHILKRARAALSSPQGTTS